MLLSMISNDSYLSGGNFDLILQIIFLNRFMLRQNRKHFLININRSNISVMPNIILNKFFMKFEPENVEL